MRKQPQRNSLIKNAIQAGINYFDVTQAEETKSLGFALKELGDSSDVHVAIMTLTPFRKMAKKSSKEWRKLLIDDVQKSLDLLQSDYADILNVHMPEIKYSRERLKGALKIFEELKDRGKIGSLGASSHQLRFLAELIRKFDCFDSVMVRFNYHLQEAREVIFPLCKAFDIGVVVMKPLTWPYYGIPFMRFGPVDGEEGPFTPAQMSIRWVLDSSEVSTVVPGMNSLTELEENLDALKIEEKVDEMILERYLKASQGPNGKNELEKMLNDSDVDIRYFSNREMKKKSV